MQAYSYTAQYSAILCPIINIMLNRGVHPEANNVSRGLVNPLTFFHSHNFPSFCIFFGGVVDLIIATILDFRHILGIIM